MWILKIPNSTMKDKLTLDDEREKLIDYIKEQIEGGITVSSPIDFYAPNWKDFMSITFIVYSNKQEIGTIKWIGVI